MKDIIIIKEQTMKSSYKIYYKKFCFNVWKLEYTYKTWVLVMNEGIWYFTTRRDAINFAINILNSLPF